jgi:type II secretory pathway pseudopilin PulG
VSNGTSSAVDALQGELSVAIRKAQGFALIDLIFACGMIALLCSIALPRLLLARQSAAASSAIGSMRALNSAELTYALTCGSGFYAPSLTTLGTAPPGSNEPFVGGGLGASNIVVKSTYTIQLTATGFVGAPATCNGLAAGAAGQGFRAAADSSVPDFARYFATNANGVIFEDTASLWAGMPEVGAPPTGRVLH